MNAIMMTRFQPRSEANVVALLALASVVFLCYAAPGAWVVVQQQE